MFYVGQRVKKVRGVEGIGNTATITAIPSTEFLTGGWIDAILDGAVVNSGGDVFFPGEEAAIRPDQWEPILPPGLESLEEINALYEPSSVEVRA